MIKELSSLRGIFILFIFLHHMSVFPGGGGMGVAFFILLGGFAMTLGYHKKVMLPGFSYGKYLAKRAIKFYPLHWLFLLAVLPLSLEKFSWITFGMNAALLQSWIPNGDFFFGYNMVAWYLSDTLFFAIVFPLCFRWITHSSIKGRCLLSAIVVLLYSFLVYFTPVNYRHAILYINPLVRLLDFIAGVLLGLVFIKYKDNLTLKAFVEKRSNMLNLLILLSIAMLVVQAVLFKIYSIAIFPLFWPLIAFIILFASLLGVMNKSGRIIHNKWLIYLGEYSFPFYIMHQVMIRYIYRYIRPSLCMLTDNRYILQVMLIIVCFVITIIVTIIIHNYINKPVTQWLTKKIHPSTTVQ